MRRKNYKGRCEKRSLEKFTSICKTYDPIQSAYANILVENKDIAEVRCNVVLDDDCSEYMTDFVCTKTNGDLMVRECISTKLLEKPLLHPRVSRPIMKCPRASSCSQDWRERPIHRYGANRYLPVNCLQYFPSITRSYRKTPWKHGGMCKKCSVPKTSIHSIFA